jgi:hypothetical protein
MSCAHVAESEFLTKKITCASEMSKKTTCEKIDKNDHVSVAACLARRHVSRAAWAKSGKPLPPPPTPACWLTAIAVDRRFQWWALPP